MSTATLERIRNYLKDGEEFKLLTEDDKPADDISTATKAKFPKDDETIDLTQESGFEKDGQPIIFRVILHCWLHRDSTAAEYLADCQKRNITNIPFLQRTDLLNWLTGKSEESQYLKKAISVSGSAEGTPAAQVSGEADHTGPGTTQTGASTGNATAVTGVSQAATAAAGTATGTTTTTSRGLQGEAATFEASRDDPALAEILKHERPLSDHNSYLRGAKPIDFGYLIKDAELKLIQPLKASMRNSKQPAQQGRIYKGHMPISPNILRKDPIILIPSAASSVITLGNIKEFLENSKYISPRNMPLSLSNDLVTIQKKFDRINRPIRFLIANNTRMFTKPEYWDRLVAVFTTGHAWQFKNYQWDNPQELFQHCKGYYFYFGGDEVPQHVQQWNVQRIELDRNKRFKDVNVVRLFWDSLERELLARGYR